MQKIKNKFMIKKIIISLIGILLILSTLHWYIIRPSILSKNVCESTYEYHLSSNDIPFNYHTAVGIAGPLTKFDSKREAIKFCVYFHKKMYRSSFPFYLF